MQETIINRVANSGLLSLDLAEYFHPGERVVYDIKDNLFQGLILREKDFRESVKAYNWEQYTGKNVAITCSADAIVPTWAYMLLASRIEPYANKLIFGTLKELESIMFHDAVQAINIETYKGQRIVVKGCGDVPVPVSAYVDIVAKLRPHVKSIMYGEPCSTVPVYKSKD